jgi:hypothetical protein
MSRFYADIKGKAGAASRIGSTNSGIHGHIRGWDLGVEVYGHDSNGSDEFEVWITGGSRGARKRRMIGTLTEKGFLHCPPTST